MPRRISEAERAVLERYLEPAEPRRRLPAAGRSQHVYPLKVRWSDVDAYRHVNNVKYVEYFQEARVGYQMAMHQRGDHFGEFVIARTDVDYRRPILFRLEPYQVHTWVSHVGNSSYTLAAEIRDGDDLLASSQAVVVSFDAETQRSAPLPEHQRAALLAQLEES
jgi:acyl-CoA thioester hydrolase